MPPRRRRRRRSDVDTLDSINIKIQQQLANIRNAFDNETHCKNLYNYWKNGSRTDDEARRGHFEWKKLLRLRGKQNQHVQEETAARLAREEEERRRRGEEEHNRAEEIARLYSEETARLAREEEVDGDREENLTLDRLYSQIAAQEQSIRLDFVSESNCRALHENWRVGRQTDDQAKRGYDALEKLNDLYLRVRNLIEEEDAVRAAGNAAIGEMSPAFDGLRLGENDDGDGDVEMVVVNAESVDIDESNSTSLDNDLETSSQSNELQSELFLYDFVEFLHDFLY